MRTRNLPKMLSSEVTEYLENNDIIIVPVGVIELHGGFPLNSETIISEAYASCMAEACNGLYLTGLQYFYAGATASGKGTVQVSVRQGIDYLYAIAEDLLRQGFKRQIYISFHGPAHMTCGPVMRDFYDHTGVSPLYIDLSMAMMKSAKDLFKDLNSFHAITVGAYQIMNCLNDVPLTISYSHTQPQSCAAFNDLFAEAYQSSSTGYCFQDVKDHMSTPAIPDEKTRTILAEEGVDLIHQLVDRMNMPHVVDQMAKLKEYNDKTAEQSPWIPAAFNREKI